MIDAARERLLVIRLSAFGDVIHTIPAVVALREALPETEIAWAVEPPYAELVERVAGVKPIRVSLKRWSIARIAAAKRDVRGFSAAIDFQGLIKSALIARASGAGERYGFARDVIRETPAAWFVNRHANVDRSKHVVEWNLALARTFAPAIARVPEVDFTPFAEDASGELARFANRVVLLPGAGKPGKQWPVERFAKLAARIGGDAVVVWGPGEEEHARAIGAEVAPATNFRELAFVLSRARLVIGADTGPLHLAAALGTPLIGLYGPTDPARNGPYGQLDRVVSSFATTKSMDDIAVDAVERLILKINVR
ncbi:MAG TPA: lipopolysaccharide heptosyltransferase I [Thermoanaerobaculia bacterium]|jgi:lipopolysaccharide heptosyltransferase I|nr:lipopolysaccharide heptosyltransferase I [Thermoanaerobaculia bacterium]